MDINHFYNYDRHLIIGRCRFCKNSLLPGILAEMNMKDWLHLEATIIIHVYFQIKFPTLFW